MTLIQIFSKKILVIIGSLLCVMPKGQGRRVLELKTHLNSKAQRQYLFCLLIHQVDAHSAELVVSVKALNRNEALRRERGHKLPTF